MSSIPRDRLAVLADTLAEEVTLTRADLVAIGKELIEGDQGTMDKANLENIVYMLETGKPVKEWQVQSVFSDYAARALEGKMGGKRSRSRKGRTHCKSRSRRSRHVKK